MRILIALILVLPLASVPTSADESGPWNLFGDGRLIGDVVEDLPNGRQLTRGHAHVRFGGRRMLGTSWELTASLHAAFGRGGSAENLRDLDNERSNTLDVDRLALRWLAGGSTEIAFGRVKMPAAFGPMIWDRDLRPIGLFATHSADVRSLDVLHLTAGYAHPGHPLEIGSETRMTFVQADWRIRDGAPRQGGITASWITFDSLEALVPSGLRRTNTAAGLSKGFQLLDLQFVGQLEVGERPLRLLIHGVDNLDADEYEHGIHAAVNYGHRKNPGDWQLELSSQRVQRHAAVAAFNEDDWWFPTGTRGTRLSFAWQVLDSMALRASAISERYDELPDDTGRLMIELLFDLDRD